MSTIIKHSTKNYQRDIVIAEYIWIGGNNELRSKTRIYYDITSDIFCNDDFRVALSSMKDWNFDGSSTGQAKTLDSEIIIKPVNIFPCPFRRGVGVLVLCDTYDTNGIHLPTNTRYNANKIFEQKPDEIPWYGIEQEFFLYNSHTSNPLGFNNECSYNPVSQGQYYCAIGSENSFGRNIMEESLDNMLYANLDVSGINAEVAPGQWEFQIGPVTGIEAGDQLWIARYILERTAEKYNTHVEYHPKPLGINNDWNGSGCHTNFSTENMREDGGLNYIMNAIEKLKNKHSEHMEVYGKYNNLRMSGKHETASYDNFTWGVADRGSSIRIGTDVFNQQKGYFEDRRPASNADPYLVTSKIFETVCLI